jgi:hypothetical protein
MCTLAEQAFQLFQHLPAGSGHNIRIPPDRDTSADTHGHLVEVIHRTEHAGCATIPQARIPSARDTGLVHAAAPEAVDDEGGVSRGERE